MDLVRLKQRAIVGLEMYYGDNRDDTHMFQLIKAHDVAQHIRRKQVSIRYHSTLCLVLACAGCARSLNMRVYGVCLGGLGGTTGSALDSRSEGRGFDSH